MTFRGILLIGGWIALVVPLQGARETAVGLVMDAPDAAIRRLGDNSVLALHTGELLFPGDVVIAGARAMTFAFCPAGKPAMREKLDPGGEVLVRANDLPVRKPRLSADGKIDTCVLPDAERRWNLDASPRTAPPPPSGTPPTPPAPSDDILATVSRAASLQRKKLADWASQAFRDIAAKWSGATWSKELVLDPSSAPARAGAEQTYAVVIGIREYSKQDGKKFRNLNFADRDAEQFAAYLESERGGKLVRNTNLFLMRNREATKSAIDRKLEGVFRTAGEGDSVILFASAHGAAARDGGGFLVTYDTDPQNLETTAYSFDQLKSWTTARGGGLKKVYLFLDVCRAARFAEIPEKNEVVNRVRGAVKNTPADLFAVMASSSDEPAWEYKTMGDGHGAFSYFLLRGLNTKSKTILAKESDRQFTKQTPAITREDIFDYVEQMVMKATDRNQRPRTVLNRNRTEALADLSKPGISIVESWEPIPKHILERQEATRSSEDVYDLASAPEQDPLIRLENLGQRIILKYLQGDEFPPSPSDYANGIGIYQMALALDPGSPFLESKLAFFEGRYLIEEKDYARAIERLERSVKLDPGSSIALNALGIAYLQQAQYDPAMAAFRDASSRAPYWAYPRHNLALALAQTGDYDGAIEQYRLAMQFAPRYSYLPYNLGLVFQKINRVREAEESYEKARDLAKALGRIPVAPTIALGVLNSNSGREKKAREYFGEARRLLAQQPDPVNTRVLRHNLALLPVRTRDERNASIGLLEQNLAERYIPSMVSLAELLMRPPAGSAEPPEQRKERLQRADAVYRTILEQKPEYVGARLAHTGVLEQLAEYDQARVELEAAHRFEPNNAVVLERQGDFELSHGTRDRAREFYDRAQEFAADPSVRHRIRAKRKRVRP